MNNLAENLTTGYDVAENPNDDIAENLTHYIAENLTNYIAKNLRLIVILRPWAFLMDRFESSTVTQRAIWSSGLGKTKIAS